MKAGRPNRKLKKFWLWLLVPAALIFGYIFRDNSGTPAKDQTATTTVQEVSEGVSISVVPARIEQGDPAKVVINGVDTSRIRSLTYKGKNVGVFPYNGKPSAFIGIDLKEKTGAYPLVLTLDDGQVVKQSLVVGAREIAQAPLGIPESLGGNTPAGEANVLKILAEDNATLSGVASADAMLWNGPFRFPVADPVVTDTYGYTRLTGASTISHKGVDFRAPVGTEVYAMNSGVVKIARRFMAYGNTVVIDHGFGLQTLYMHMSALNVKEGQTVSKGELLGLSGQSGYAEGPHLHISVRIHNISIDPEKFLKFF